VGRRLKVDSCFKNFHFVGQGRLDSILSVPSQYQESIFFTSITSPNIPALFCTSKSKRL
jgi:hypothetical protein